MSSPGRSTSVLTHGWHAWTYGVEPVPARVPGTAAGALRDAGLWQPDDPRDFDAEEWWFSTRFPAERAAAHDEVILRFDGVATVFEATLNDEAIVDGTSMFGRPSVDVGELLVGDNELTIRCLPLRELLVKPRLPRARWRTRVVDDGNLRFFRTTVLGRAPGFAPHPAPVGPWRPVVLERRRRVAVDQLTVRTWLEGGDGILSVRVAVRGIGTAPPRRLEAVVEGPSGDAWSTTLVLVDGTATDELRIERPARWWPHTHGNSALYTFRLLFDDAELDARRVGFRSVESPGAVETDGVDLRLNGVPVFARGAVWTPVDPVGYSSGDVHAAVACARDAGMNMLRLPGTGVYEDDAFYDACDELGVLLWQDFMFANLDYPEADPAFRQTVEEEARDVLERIGWRPSLAVACGNSEIEQQVAMLGLEPRLGRSELFGELLPGLVAEVAPDALYVPSAPTGGDLPFRPDSGVANYYGVGAYLRPLEDARRANILFAAECLAFANVADVEGLGAATPTDPDWKHGVPRDNGATWDFEDVRDHYFRLLFSLDPDVIRFEDPERYLELSRAVTGEVMAETFGEWRRQGSPTRGALILWLRDVLPGTGWGLLDHRGEPKVAWHHVRRAFAPVAVWMTDEGLGGVDVHVANDGPHRLRADLRIALYRHYEVPVDGATAPIELPSHGALTRNIETLLGRFVDASWAYRFGPPAQHAIVASLERDGSLLSQAVRFPAGRPCRRESRSNLGLEASAERDRTGTVISIRTRRLAYGVRLQALGWSPSDDAFCVEPGHERRVNLAPRSGLCPGEEATLSALNLDHGLRIPLPAT
jgi:beta-mannosidase